jgi:hypothetical protein
MRIQSTAWEQTSGILGEIRQASSNGLQTITVSQVLFRRIPVNANLEEFSPVGESLALCDS